VAWDVINEPEWAMTGPSPYGDMPYDPTVGLEALTHAEMEAFLRDVIAALRAESGALVTVGGTALKWAHAWSRLDLDFYQFHYYDWINQYWPYTNPPDTYGLDRPAVIGELPVGDLAPGIPYLQVVNAFYGEGYAGAMGWTYREATAAQLADVQAFADGHPCDTRFKPLSAPPAFVPALFEPRPGDQHSRRRCTSSAGGKPVCDLDDPWQP
jgi:hypothetical protein